MSQQITYACDVCGKIKGEANHWFRASNAGCLLGIHIYPFMQGSDLCIDLCGEACALKWISQNLKSIQGSQADNQRSQDDNSQNTNLETGIGAARNLDDDRVRGQVSNPSTPPN